jgi:7-cyano-7-deazaguanine synthase in queuosine biosynthesis
MSNDFKIHKEGVSSNNKKNNGGIMKRVNILWTGGWDSTYRVLRLMDKHVSIQPYYLKDNRKSEVLELKAIETITRDIRNHPHSKCEVLELITMNVSDVPVDAEITKAYKNILKTDFYGSQYDWLARFAKKNKNLELCIHEDDKAVVIIKKYGSIIKEHDDLIGDYYVLDKDKSSEDLIQVFGNFHFPILSDSKLEMKEWAINSGLIDIMNKTWFCFKPINNKPCGRCNPCTYAIEEGMEYRFSKSAMRRYRFNKFIKPVRQSVFMKGTKKMYKILKRK